MTGSERRVGLWGATTVGVGAIVGGGVLALSGAAFKAAGPSAVLAFAANGVVAFVTAMSFAEVSTRFPESGGAYTFAKKVLSVNSAFAAGWVLWFAYIVAGVLYALGFAAFAAEAVRGGIESFGYQAPRWLGSHGSALFFATVATVLYALSLARKAKGGGQVATYGKVFVFSIIIVAGVVALLGQSVAETSDNFRPFLPGGTTGLLSAMGFTFIALQGFDLIAAIAGEVRDPTRNLPRAMFFSLGIALAVYLPLLLVSIGVGVPDDTNLVDFSSKNPDTMLALGVRNFMGPVGYWLVVMAGVLSFLSALHANLLAASRVALTMARDRTLPEVLSAVHKTRNTPLMAIYASALTLIAIVFMVSDVETAGATASLIFLISFAFVHGTTYLARIRGGQGPGYRTPWFPLVPVVGGAACTLLAVFQAVAEPNAGGVVAMWVGLGGILYLSLFRSRAQTFDAHSEALDPSLAKLRGKSPLVLVPVANPAHARSVVEIANAIAPSEVAKVLLLTIISRSKTSPAIPTTGLADAQEVIRQALVSSYNAGHTPEALITAAYDPWQEIRRVAEEHKCESVLVGLGQLSDDRTAAELEALLNDLDDCDVSIVRAPVNWSLDKAKNVLVAVGGRGDQHGLRARFLGSISRGAARHITFVTVLGAHASAKEVRDAKSSIAGLADVKVPGAAARVEVLQHDSVADALLQRARDCDLLLLGTAASPWGKKSLGPTLLEILRKAPCATIVVSRRLAGHTELAKDIWGSIRG